MPGAVGASGSGQKNGVRDQFPPAPVPGVDYVCGGRGRKGGKFKKWPEE